MDRDGGADASPAVQEARPLDMMYIQVSEVVGATKITSAEEKKRENEELNEYVSLFRAIPTLGSSIGKPTLLVGARIPYGATVNIVKHNIRNANGL
jgi:hypothetical protein